jgi:hypothetical protein
MNLTKADIQSFIPSHWICLEIDGTVICQPPSKPDATHSDTLVQQACVDGVSLMLTCLCVPHRRVGSALVFHLMPDNNQQTVTE